MNPLRVAKRIVPAAGKEWIRCRWRQFALRRGLRELRSLPVSAKPSHELLRNLVYGWGNQGWSVQYEFMQAIVDYIRSTDGPVLESGPGLSSLLMATCARESGKEIWSLEHDQEWAETLTQRFARLGMENVRVVFAPLVSYGDYDWYDIVKADLPDNFGLALCDGPPSNTRGGRYGMLPQVSERLCSGAVVLIDDMERQSEQEMLHAWRATYGGTFAVYGEDKPYAVYRPGSDNQ